MKLETYKLGQKGFAICTVLISAPKALPPRLARRGGRTPYSKSASTTNTGVSMSHTVGSIVDPLDEAKLRQGILSARGFFDTYGFLPPIAGAADGEGDPPADGDPPPADGDKPPTDGDKPPAEADEEDSDDDVLELSRKDYNRLRESARKLEAAERKREKEEKERKEKAARDAGEFDKLIQAERDERLQIEAERDEARIELHNERKKLLVEKVARRLGFKDMEDALHNITDEDSEDEKAAERALKVVLKRKPYLAETRRPSGAPLDGNGTGVTLTLDQIKTMSQDEINANWDEVQKAMAAGI